MQSQKTKYPRSIAPVDNCSWGYTRVPALKKEINIGLYRFPTQITKIVILLVRTMQKFLIILIIKLKIIKPIENSLQGK